MSVRVMDGAGVVAEVSEETFARLGGDWVAVDDVSADDEPEKAKVTRKRK